MLPIPCVVKKLTLRYVDLASITKLYWSPEEEDFVVERPSLMAGDVDVEFPTEHAPHTLFTTQDISTAQQSEERLRLHVFFDRSVLEIFVNERTVITTRIYTHDARCIGLALFAEPVSDSVLTMSNVWDGLGCA